MFKLKMSLLLKSAKFKATVAVFAIAAIIAGIVIIPINRAGKPSASVRIACRQTGVTVAGHNIYSIKSDPDPDTVGYKNIFCIQEGEDLSYAAYTNPIEFSSAKDYFNFPNAARWLIDNMYITNISGRDGLSNEVAKNVMLMNMANLLTTKDIKNKVASYGFDVSGITPQDIYSLKDVRIGKDEGYTYSANALEAVEQLALWKYTKNLNTNASDAYRNNPNQYLEGTSLTGAQQKALKYTYYALTAFADMKNNSDPSGTLTNYVTLDKGSAKFDENTYKVGPYYLNSNGFRLTSYSFGTSGEGKYPINVTVTKNDGSEVKVENKLVEKNDDGSFYINLNDYRDNVKKVNFSVAFIASTVVTEAYVADGGSNQNLMDVQKSVGATSLSDSKNIEITNPEGTFSIVLKKVKKDGTTVITNEPATFKINGNEKNTESGIINIEKGAKIENEKQTKSYTIEETKAPKGYNRFEGTLKLDVKFKLDGKKYIIDRNNTKTEGFKNGAKVDISSDNTTITIYVPNDEIPTPGEYNVELYKVDDKGNVIKTPAKFEINGKETTTSNGVIEVAKNVKVDNESTVGRYSIKETEAPENYYLYDGLIKLTVMMKKENNSYVLKEDGIKFDYTANSTTNNDKKPSFILDGSTIKVYVPNTPKKFDLSLRKFISKIDGKDVTPSREPIINEQSIKNLEQTGTASYYHIKDSIGVTVGSEVEYTIRVYNEGEILGYAKTITDYIPDGLTFVKIADESAKEYTTTAKEGDKTIVLNYKGNTVIERLRDFIGKKDIKVTDKYYQEVKVICKVNDTDKTYITSRAEITNYGYNQKEGESTVWKEAKEIGNVDIDSVQDTIKDALDLDTWYENAKERTYQDENGKTVVDKNYFPGVQDDDDFETVEILSGKYNIVIKKIDKKDKTPLAGAYFGVKGSNIDTEVGPTSNDGIVSVIKGVQIVNEKQVDNYTIKETKSPVDYHKYDGDIKVKIATKFNGKTFVIDDKNTTVDGKEIEFTMNQDKTTITIIVPNEKKEFDLALRKFITEVNGKELENSRVPQVDITKLASGESTTATYKHPKDPVDVNPTDIVTYTIRVYNEGEVDGYATKVMDDIPEGLEFLPENEINKDVWVMYRELKDGEKVTSESTTKTYNGKVYVVTNNAKEAVLIETASLENELIKAFDGKTLDYKDVKVAFKVVEPATSDRILINYAQITEHKDGRGNLVIDRDSTPNEWNDGEDDQDIDKVKVRYFDLALRKWVTKAIVNENGKETITETKHAPWDDPEPVVKVDLKDSNLNNVTVKFEYSIRIYNQGEIAGYAKEISDYIPEGLKFVKEDNPQWNEVDGKIVTRALENTLLQPGDYADVTVLLTWINGTNNLGLKNNIAEISEDYNDYGTPDIDSTPNNKVPGEDDIDDAPVILTVRTGKPIVYTGIAIAVIAIVSLGVVVIKKRVLDR